MSNPLDNRGAAGSPPLVAAMLMPPRSATAIVSRPRLLELLDTVAGGPVTIVSGEAAAGKTSAVVDWIGSVRTGRPVAWLTLPRELANPILFWRYVLAAVEPFGVECHDLKLALDDLELPDDRWLTALANRLGEVPDDPVIVFDDVQELNRVDGWRTLLPFLERTPTTVHVLLLSRSKPPRELTRWQVSGRLGQIDSADLRFTHDEARALLDAARIELGDVDVELLVRRTEGWAGGLRLALLSMRHAPDPSAFVARFAADDELVSSFLFREVLERQSAELREFLLDISVLDQITPETCDAIRERDDSGELLEQCRAESLFLSESSGSGAYRLHALFAQLLRATLDMTDHDRLVTVLGRASTVFEEAGDVRAAIAFAVDADDFSRAGELITRHAGEFARRGRFDEIRAWLSLFPKNTVSLSAEVVIGLAMTLSICGQTGDAVDLLDRREASGSSPRSRYASNQARLVANALDGDVEMMARSAQILSEDVPAGDLALPFEPVRMALCYQGIGAFFAGDLEAARGSLAQAADMREDPNVQFVETPGWLARVALAEGDLAESERLARECLTRNEVLGGAETAVVTMAHLSLGDIAWERNLLDEAEVALAKARRSVRPLLWLSVLVQISTSRMLAGRGQLDEARQGIIESGQTYLVGDHSPQLRALVSSAALELALMAGDLDDALRWERSFKDSTDRPLPVSLELRLAALAGVDDIAARVEHAIGAKQTLPREIDTLLAGAELIGGADERRRNELVASATQLAERSGFVRLFVDAGTNVHAALEQLAEAPSIAGEAPIASQFYLGSLVSALGTPVTAARRSRAQNDELVEPLTERELQVLGLLARGNSYSGIGAELYVSRNTVKTHASHIYTKLGVSGRLEATEAARQLGLIQ